MDGKHDRVTEFKITLINTYILLVIMFNQTVVMVMIPCNSCSNLICLTIFCQQFPKCSGIRGFSVVMIEVIS